MLRRWLALAAPAALCAADALAQDILVVDRTNLRVVAVSGVDGQVLDPAFIDLTSSTGTAPVDPVQANDFGDEIWITDRGAPVVFRFDQDGAYLGEIDPGPNAVRGVGYANSRLWVASSGTPPGTDDALRVYTQGGVLKSVFGVTGTTDPWSVVFYIDQEVLVSDGTGDDIDRYGMGGLYKGSFHDSDGVTGIDAPRQIAWGLNGSLLAAGHDSPSGIYEYDLYGTQLAYHDTESLGFGGVEGVQELEDGKLLFTNGNGVHVFDPVGGTVTTVFGGIDAGFATLRRDTPDWRVTQLVDAGGAGGQMICENPLYTAVDGQGNLYVSSTYSDRVLAVTPGGYVTQLIGPQGDGLGNVLDTPWGIAATDAGDVYVSSRHTYTVFHVAPDGTIEVVLDATGDGAGNVLTSPDDVAVDAAGNVYVAGYFSDNVFRVTPAGVVTEIIDASGDGAGHPLTRPSAVAADAAGNVFVAGSDSHNVFRITPGGSISLVLDATGDGAGHALDRPTGLTVHQPTGDLYVTGFGSRNVFRVTPGGAITEILDSTGDGAGNLYLNGESDVAVTDAGVVYAAGKESPYLARLFEVRPSGRITLVQDQSGDGTHELLDPHGLVMDDDGNLYVLGAISDNAFRLGAPVTLGTPYCDPANPNSTGAPATITATGSEVVTNDTLSLHAWDLPPNQFGYFLASETMGFVANPGGSQGNLCLGGTIGRFAKDAQSSGAEGRFSIDVDLQAMPPPLTAVMAGETWNFQAWYRDKNPGSTSNFTDAVSVMFL